MAWIHNNLFLPLLEPERHKGLGQRLRALERFEASSPKHQREAQAESVRRLLDHAYRTTPYYRALFDQQDAHPSDWKEGSPIPVPVLTRDLIRSHEDDLRSRRYSADELRAAATGGTTSTPVRLWRDVEALRQKTALQYHLNRLTNFDQGDSVLMIWGAERDLELNPSWRWRLYENRILRRIPAAAGEVSASIFKSFLDRLNRHRPKVLYGYGVTVARFADFVRTTSTNWHRPSVVIITAEVVTHSERQCIEETFGCQVTEQYGSRDVGMVASECHLHSGVHFHPAGCLVEFAFAGMTPDGPMHHLLVTDLLNYGMPLIRYDTGDCVIVDEAKCACGLWYPKVKTVLGRAMDNFLLPDGREVPGITLATRMVGMKSALRHITQVQFVQKAIDHLLVRYAARGTETDIQGELSRLGDVIRDVLNSKPMLTFDRVLEIPRERSGKQRLCISEVKRTRLASN
jgi:phenylacetate-CoA ligase